MKKLILMSVIIMILGLTPSCLAEKERGIGLGTHYQDGYTFYMASLRTKVGWVTLDGNVDYYSSTGTGEISYISTPGISFLINILGSGVYAGVGIEKTYTQWTSGVSEWSNPTYLLQVDWEIMRIGAVSLSLDTQYKSLVFSLQDIKPESLTFGARLFFYF